MSMVEWAKIYNELLYIIHKVHKFQKNILTILIKNDMIYVIKQVFIPNVRDSGKIVASLLLFYLRRPL